MTIQLGTRRTEIERDRYGRYLLPNPETGQVQAWTRVTTIAKKLDDDGSLRNYDRRMVASGIAARPDLLAMVTAAGSTDRRDLDEACEIAYDAGGGTAKARQGTALHKIIERVLRGEVKRSEVPDLFRADVEAFFRALDDAGFTVELVELVVIIPEIGAAGTLDVGLRSKADGKLYLGDLKSGHNVHYAWDSILGQMTCYSRATHAYVEGQLVPLDQLGIDQDRAFILHLPYGTGECRVYEVGPLGPVWDFVLMAVGIRSFRGQGKQMVRPYVAPAPGVEPTEPEPEPEPAPAAAEPEAETSETARYQTWAAWAIDRITSMDETGMQMLGERWPAGVPTFRQVRESSAIHTLEEQELIGQIIGDIEKATEMPFGPTPPSDAIADVVPRFAQRIENLPADFQAALESWRVNEGIPNLRSSEATTDHVRAVEGALSDLEVAFRSRLDRWDDAVKGCVVEGNIDPLLAQVGRTSLRECTRAEGEAVVALAVAMSHLDVAFTDGQVVIAESVADALKQKFGDARAITAAAAPVADALGRIAPKTLKAVAADPVLVAVLLHGTNN